MITETNMDGFACPHCGGVACPSPSDTARAAHGPLIAMALDFDATGAHAQPFPMIQHWTMVSGADSDAPMIRYGDGEPVLAPWSREAMSIGQRPDWCRRLNMNEWGRIIGDPFVAHEIDRRTGFGRLALIAERNARIEAERAADPTADEETLRRRAQARPLGAGLPFLSPHPMQPAEFA